MLQTTLAIVLHTLPYNDSTQMLHVYTQAAGRMTLLAHASRSKAGKVRPAVLQPLALIELEADLRPTSRLQHVRQARVVQPMNQLPTDPYKSAIAMYLAEFLYRALKEQVPSRPLFAYLWQSVLQLDACTRGVANFHLACLLPLATLLGVAPNLNDYTPGATFDLLEGCFVQQPPTKHVYYLPPSEAKAMPTLMRMNYRNMHLFRMSRAQRTRCLQLVHDYYRLHLPDLPPLRSAEVLQAVFQ